MADEPNTPTPPAAPKPPAAKPPQAPPKPPAAAAKPAPKPPAPPIPPADPNPALLERAATAAADEERASHGSYTLPTDFAREDGAALLLNACEVFGVNPDPDTLPPELKGWKFYKGNRLEGRPDSVVLVTHGGVKLTWFASAQHPDAGLLSTQGAQYDAATETRLRAVFRAWRQDPKTKEVQPTALPEDLTLPQQAVTGLSDAQAHVYKDGYLQAGGKKEATRRQDKGRRR
jgi:hypothetical protein